MKQKSKDNLKRIFCDKCKYGNHIDFVKYTGVCHCCGKILDEKAYFKAQMNKKMRLWRGKNIGKWNYTNMR